MSLTRAFEKRAIHTGSDYQWMYGLPEVHDLLAHARALEAMLKKHEWAARVGYDGDSGCPECREEDFIGHAPDCALAKLLEGVE